MKIHTVNFTSVNSPNMARNLALWVNYLPYKHKDLNFDPQHLCKKWSMIGYTCNSSAGNREEDVKVMLAS